MQRPSLSLEHHTAGGHEAAGAAYLPLVARKATAWAVLLDATSAEVIGYLPLDPS
jgi:hypothetical protein